jgi:hypothetical protein
MTQDEMTELGQESILAHVKAMVRLNPISTEEFVFRWRGDFEKTHWCLYAHRGRHCRSLRFEPEVLRSWPRSTDAADKYQRAIFEMTQWFLSNRSEVDGLP